MSKATSAGLACKHAQCSGVVPEESTTCKVGGGGGASCVSKLRLQIIPHSLLHTLHTLTVCVCVCVSVCLCVCVSVCFVCSVSDGCAGVSVLLKWSQVAKATGRTGQWHEEQVMPIQLPVPPANRKHSVFVCPVSK